MASPGTGTAAPPGLQIFQGNSVLVPWVAPPQQRTEPLGMTLLYRV